MLRNNSVSFYVYMIRESFNRMIGSLRAVKNDSFEISMAQEKRRLQEIS